MRYLLDSHTLIWYFSDSAKLPPRVIEVMETSKNEFFISSVSLWEIAIKMNINKLDIKLTLDEILYDVNTREIGVLHIEDAYLRCLSGLPFIHKDPFDRIVISTALAEGLTIITADENIHKYEVPWIW